MTGSSVIVNWDATPPGGYLAPDEVVFWQRTNGAESEASMGKVLQGSKTVSVNPGQVIEVGIGSRNSLGTTWGTLSGTNRDTVKINVPGAFTATATQCTERNARGAEVAQCQMVSLTLPSTWAADALPMKCSMWDDFSQSYATFTPRGGAGSSFETGVRLSKANVGNLGILIGRITCSLGG